MPSLTPRFPACGKMAVQLGTVPEAMTPKESARKAAEARWSKTDNATRNDCGTHDLPTRTEEQLRAITRAPDVVDSVANWQHGRIPPPAAEIRQGTKRDAILHSVGANAAHGLRRSNDDKRRAVEMLLRDEEWGKRSDRWIAEQCGVSNTSVQRYREQLSHCDSSPERTGQDGKVRRLPVKPPKVEAEPLPEEVAMPDEELEVRGNVAPC